MLDRYKISSTLEMVADLFTENRELKADLDLYKGFTEYWQERAEKLEGDMLAMHEDIVNLEQKLEDKDKEK